jgi:hypothetical protein
LVCMAGPPGLWSVPREGRIRGLDRADLVAIVTFYRKKRAASFGR